MSETSTRPYLIRAIYEWCTDNGYRPFISVTVDERTQVPREHVRNGEIVLNVSAGATDRLQLGNEFIEFDARFGGVVRHVSVPVENVGAVYAAENGHGMAFDVRLAQPTQAGPESEGTEASPGATAASDAAPRGAPQLAAVRSEDSPETAGDGAAGTGDVDRVQASPRAPAPVEKPPGAVPDPTPDPTPPAAPGGRPRLKVVK